MKMILPAYIGLRYLRAKRSNTFISFVSMFAFLGMALGVFALVVVLSVMNGFDRELKQRILRIVPHAFLIPEQPLTDWRTLVEETSEAEGLLGAAPFVQGYGLLSYDGNVQGIEIQGIHPEAEKSVSAVHHHMLVGDTDRLEPGEFQIVLGSLLARYLNVSTGDKVSLTMPKVSITPAGVFPRSKRFTVAGVFEVGAQVDQSLVLVHIEDAQRLFRRGDSVDGLRLRFDDIYRSPAYMKNLEERLGEGYTGKDWSETQGSLFQAVKMEKMVVGIMLGIIIAVAAFNIVTSLIMMIAEKRSDIAVLRTMGMASRGIVAIFMVQGVVIGLVGIFLGALAGTLVAVNLAAMVTWFESLVGAQIFDPTVYFVTTMPSQLLWSDVVWVCSGAVVVSIIATTFPAYKASRIAPAEALRYNV